MSACLLQLSGAVIDLLYEVDEVPRAGEEALVHGFRITPGGGFNAMVAAKRADMKVCYGGGMGVGPFARIVQDGLSAEGIPVLQPVQSGRDQGCCTVLIDRGGERTFVASEGADGYITDAALETISGCGCSWTLLSGYALYHAGSRDALTRWLRSDRPIPNFVFDPSPLVHALPADGLAAARARASWISANTGEATKLTGTADPGTAARRLAEECPSDGGAVVRDGKNGCVVATRGQCQTIPGFPVAAIDTNGAGDTHLGSFIARLAHGDSPVEAADYANVAAALSTTRKGPATAPDLDIVVEAMNRRQAS